MDTTNKRIEEIKKEGYQLDFTTVFGNAFENYKKIALTVGLLFIIVGIIVIAIAALVATVFFGFNMDYFVENSQEMEKFKFSSLPTIYLLLYVIGMVVFTAITSPITAGVLKIAHNARINQEVSIGTAFDFYKQPYFKELFVSTSLIAFFSVIVNLIFETVGFAFIGVFFTYVVSFFTFLTIPFIIFGNLKAIDAIQASFTVVSKNILILVGLLICAALFVLIGMIACCIGILFTMPFIYSMYYSIYNEVIGVGVNDEIDEINGVQTWN